MTIGTRFVAFACRNFFFLFDNAQRSSESHRGIKSPEIRRCSMCYYHDNERREGLSLALSVHHLPYS
jgi:hypothetical protein